MPYQGTGRPRTGNPINPAEGTCRICAGRLINPAKGVVAGLRAGHPELLYLWNPEPLAPSRIWLGLSRQPQQPNRASKPKRAAAGLRAGHPELRRHAIQRRRRLASRQPRRLPEFGLVFPPTAVAESARKRVEPGEDAQKANGRRLAGNLINPPKGSGRPPCRPS
jgi:hypothetical protein